MCQVPGFSQSSPGVIAPAQQHIPFGGKFLQNAAGEKIGSTPVLLYWMVDNHLLQQKSENGVANTSKQPLNFEC